MPYTAQITRDNPSCILFLLDQSGSMSDPFGGSTGRSKADQLANAINRLLFELVMRCVKDANEGPRNYYEIGVLGYGLQTRPYASAFLGSLAGRDLVWIRDLADNPARIEDRTQKVDDGNGGLVEIATKLPIWLDPRAENGTPTAKAMKHVYTLLDTWVRNHRTAYPPIVIHITDGEPDSDPSAEAKLIRGLATEDGPVLLFNLHLSAKLGQPIFYPHSSNQLPDKFASQLFEMSSPLPDAMVHAAQAEGYPAQPGARGFVFNADFEALIKFLDLGTQVANLR